MQVFLITLQAVAALLGIGVLGFWIIGRRQIPSKSLGFLTSIAIDIALPCLILSNILLQFSPKEFPDWWKMPLWFLGFTMITIVLSIISSKMVNKKYRGEFTISLIYQNGIFFPLIIITGIFGSDSSYLIQLFLFIFLHASYVYSTYALFLRNYPSPEPPLSWRRIANSILIATVLGIVISLVGASNYVPDFLIMALTMIGAMSTPLFMLILGGNVYNDFLGSGASRKIYTGEVVKFVLIKNLLFPLVFLGLLLLVRPDYSIAFIIILQAAVPPITAIPIFTERAGGNRALSNQLIVASFLFSILSIPLAIYVFSLFFPFPL